MIKEISKDITMFMWRFKEQLGDHFYSINSYGESSQVEITESGTYCKDGDFDFTGSKISLSSSSFTGNCKFFENIRKFEEWKKFNIDKAAELAFAIIISNKDASNYHHTASIPLIFINIPHNLLEKLMALRISNGSICSEYIAALPEIKRLSIFERVIIERIEDKSKNILEAYSFAGENLIGMFVFSIFDTIEISSSNRKQYKILAEKIGFYKILSNLNTIEEAEALIFGAAGLLEESFYPDQYIYLLRNKFDILRKQYKIIPMSPRVWKSTFSSSLHYNIAYLASLLFQNRSLFYEIVECNDLDKLRKLLETPVSEYWQEHTNFGIENEQEQKRVSLNRSKIDLMIINGIIPFLFSYFKISKNRADVVDFIFDLYENIPPEDNKFITQWSSNGYTCKNAMESQSLIHLSKQHCQSFNCPFCEIGIKLLNN